MGTGTSESLEQHWAEMASSSSGVDKGRAGS